MITLKEYPEVHFLNFEDEGDVRMFVEGDGAKAAEPLYKYSLWKNAQKLLDKRYLWMSYPTVWKDPFESYFIDAKYVDSSNNSIVFPFKNKIFCNCLTPDHNSEAHWNTYAKDEPGVSLRINVKELVNQLNNFGKANPHYKIYLGKVSYLKESAIKVKSIFDIPLLEDDKGRIVNRDINDPEFCANLFLLKRRSFKHDNEVRLIIIHEDNEDELKGIEFNYNWDSLGMQDNNYANEKLFARVFTSPYYDKKNRDKIRNELEGKKYGFNKYTVYKKGGIKANYSRIQQSLLFRYVKPKDIMLY